MHAFVPFFPVSHVMWGWRGYVNGYWLVKPRMVDLGYSGFLVCCLGRLQAEY